MSKQKIVSVFSLISLLIIFLVRCNSNEPKHETQIQTQQPVQEKDSFKTGEVIPFVSLQNDASQSFALYLPQNYSTTKKYPALLFFDPHGDGSFPLNKYFKVADHFGFVMLGSNSSKNGMQFEQTNGVVNNLLSEASSRFAVDAKRISLVGFSGGAKVVLMSAANHPELSSVIYCGASMQIQNMQQLPAALGFAGERDLNYTDVVSFDQSFSGSGKSHALIEWSGKHEWTDSVSFADAFYWCLFSDMKNKSAAIESDLIKTFAEEKTKKLSAEKNIFKQVAIYSQLISFLDGLADVSSYKQKLSAIQKSPAFETASVTKNKYLQTEVGMKENYIQCFDTKDLNWWKQETTRMRGIKKGEEYDMYQRLLGYISLAAYSMSNNAIKQNNFSSAEKTLAVYKLADPENPDQPFLSACMYARQNNNTNAIAQLNEAVRLGLKDKSKIETEESFVNLRSMPEYGELLNKMK